MSIRAIVPVLAAVRLEEHADALLGPVCVPLGLPLAVEELLNPRVILILIPVVILVAPSAVQSDLASANGLDDSELAGDRLVAKDNSLADLTLGQLVIVLEDVGIVYLLCSVWLRMEHTVWIHVVLHGHLIH